MTILITGAAGFIGFHVCRALRIQGESVIGIDNLNAYYDPVLKKARLAALEQDTGKNPFLFYRMDIADRGRMQDLARLHPDIDVVIHLAAQPGVRYALKEPFSYVESNVFGQLSVLELCRQLTHLKHLIYASSSSVYGGNTKLPFSENDRVDHPVSLYAATKKAGELMADTYTHLFSIPATGLRFFTVYGPWGRPDMAYYLFTKALFEGAPITLYEKGELKRDFTYIDDIVAGVLASVARPPAGHTIYNLGNHRSEPVKKLVALLEEATGRKAFFKEEPLPPGDMRETFADITRAARHLGFSPRTALEEGIPKFVAWYQQYYGGIRARIASVP